MTTASSSTEPMTWRRLGADRPHQGELPGPLGHDDRERVEDQEHGTNSATEAKPMRM